MRPRRLHIGQEKPQERITVRTVRVGRSNRVSETDKNSASQPSAYLSAEEWLADHAIYDTEVSQRDGQLISKLKLSSVLETYARVRSEEGRILAERRLSQMEEALNKADEELA